MRRSIVTLQAAQLPILESPQSVGNTVRMGQKEAPWVPLLPQPEFELLGRVGYGDIPSSRAPSEPLDLVTEHLHPGPALTRDRVEARPHVEQPQAYGSGGGGSSGTVRWVARRFSRSSFRTTSHGQYVRVYRPNTSTV